jgi:hypothetical protein
MLMLMDDWMMLMLMQMQVQNASLTPGVLHIRVWLACDT